MTGSNQKRKPEPISVEKAKMVMSDMFHATTERDPSSGDQLKVMVIDYEGNVDEKVVPLRAD